MISSVSEYSGCDFYWMVPKDPIRNMAFRREILQLGYANDEYAQELWIMCARDILFYINSFCWTLDPRMGSRSCLPLISWPFQDELTIFLRDAIETSSSYSTQRHNILIEKSRDMGVTWFCMIVFEWFWHFHGGRTFIVGSRDESYVDDTNNPKSLFPKIDFIHKHQPVWLLPSGRHLGRDKDPNRLAMKLINADNHSSIRGEATTDNFARGDRATAIFFDEYAATDKGQQIDNSTAPVSQVRIVNSTPQGTGNAFYQMRESKRWQVKTYHWSLHPWKRRGLYKWPDDTEFYDLAKPIILDESFVFPRNYDFRPPFPDSEFGLRSPWFDEECRTLDDWTIAQEHEINYQGSGKQWFEVALLRKIMETTVCRPYCEGFLNFDAEVIEFIPSVGGRIKLWTHLDPVTSRPDALRVFAAGVDVATGKGGHRSSNSVISIADVLTGEKILEFAANDMVVPTFTEFCVKLLRMFNNAYVCWEETGPGGAFTKTIMEIGYANIYYRHNKNEYNGKTTDVPGWHATRDNKQSVLTSYHRAIRAGNFINHSIEAINECKEYVYGENGEIIHAGAKKSASPDSSSAGVNHGDRVIADALCWHAMQDRPVYSMDDEEITEDLEQVDPRKIPHECMAARELERMRERGNHQLVSEF